MEGSFKTLRKQSDTDTDTGAYFSSLLAYNSHCTALHMRNRSNRQVIVYFSDII